MVVAGNHDSPVLLEALDFAVTAFGAGPGPGGVPRLKFVTRARHPRDGGILDYPARGGEQRIRVAALPFIHQNRFLDEFTSPATATRDYARHLREMQAELQRGLLDGYQPGQDVLVFAAHLYVQGAIPSYTERPVEISDTYLTEADALPAVSYAALGHIHRPQAITRGGMHGPLRRQPAAAGLRGGGRGQERRRGRRRPRPPGQSRAGATARRTAARTTSPAPWTNCGRRPARSATRSSGP